MMQTRKPLITRHTHTHTLTMQTRKPLITRHTHTHTLMMQTRKPLITRHTHTHTNDADAETADCVRGFATD